MAHADTKPGDTIMDLLRNMVPDNLIDAMVLSESTCVRNVTSINYTYVTDKDYLALASEFTSSARF